MADEVDETCDICAPFVDFIPSTPRSPILRAGSTGWSACDSCGISGSRRMRSADGCGPGGCVGCTAASTRSATRCSRAVDALVARYPRRPGTPAIRHLLEARVIGRNVTRDELEHRFLAFLDASEIPRPRTNRRLRLHDGTWIEADCHWAGAGLIVELDGGAAHDTRRAFESDRARDRKVVASGHRVVRITWRQLHEQPTALAHELRALLSRGP